MPFTAMQNTFAGIKPNCAVRIAMMHTITLFTQAMASPVHCFRPIKTVEITVRQQEM